jgi:hypothetical protein
MHGGRFAAQQTAWLRCSTPPSRNAEFRGSFAENLIQEDFLQPVWSGVPPLSDAVDRCYMYGRLRVERELLERREKLARSAPAGARR